MKFFTWQELCVTHSMKEQSKMRRTLDAQHIPHRIRTKSRVGSSRSLGTSGVDLEKMYEYRIFVRKNDLDQARYVIEELQ